MAKIKNTKFTIKPIVPTAETLLSMPAEEIGMMKVKLEGEMQQEVVRELVELFKKYGVNLAEPKAKG